MRDVWHHRRRLGSVSVLDRIARVVLKTVAVPERAELSRPPALDCVVIEHRARVLGSARHSLCLATVVVAEVHRHPGVSAVWAIAEPESAVAVIAPALEGVVVEYRALVHVPARHGLRGAPRAEVHRRRSVCGNAGCAVNLRVKRHLVKTPALEGVVVEDRARETIAGRQSLRRAPGAEVRRRRSESIRRRRCRDRAVPDSAAITPALDGAVVEYRARKRTPRRHGLCGTPGAKVHHLRGIGGVP